MTVYAQCLLCDAIRLVFNSTALVYFSILEFMSDPVALIHHEGVPVVLRSFEGLGLVYVAADCSCQWHILSEFIGRLIHLLEH